MPVIGLMVPALAVQVTFGLKLPLPFTTALQAASWPVCTFVGVHVADTEFTDPAVATVMTVEPVLLVSCVDVAVIVTWVVNGTVVAVNNPDVGLIVPLPLAVQVTVLLKLPVPETDAVHWLVCPAEIEVGLQLAPTRVMVEVELLLPPPQATRVRTQHAAARIPRSRTPTPLLDLVDIHALWNHSRHIRAAVEVACVSALLKHKS